MKTCLFMLFFIPFSFVYSQPCDQRAAGYMNQSDWFGLQREYRASKDSLSPFISTMSRALTDYHFNRLDSAATAIADLLNNFPDELPGESKISMICLLSDCLHRQNRNEEAAGLMADLCDQLQSAGADESSMMPFIQLRDQYRELSIIGEINRLERPDKEISIPLSVETLKTKKKGWMLYLNGTLNGKDGKFLFDTGAGANVVTPQIAREYGMKILDATTRATGINTGNGGMAIADSLRIGELLFCNVPFYVLDMATGNAEADEYMKDLGIIVGIPQMEQLGEIEIDFGNKRLVVPQRRMALPFAESNLCFSDKKNLLGELSVSKDRVIMKLDTGAPETLLYPVYFEKNKAWIEATGKLDTVRYAGFAGVQKDTVYIVGNLPVGTGSEKGILKEASISISHTVPGEEGIDGVAGLDLFMAFSRVFINLKEMFLFLYTGPQELCRNDSK